MTTITYFDFYHNRITREYKKLGSGTFASCYQNLDNPEEVLLISNIKYRERELMLPITGKSIHFPKITRVGYGTGGHTKTPCHYYKMPFYNSVFINNEEDDYEVSSRNSEIKKISSLEATYVKGSLQDIKELNIPNSLKVALNIIRKQFSKDYQKEDWMWDIRPTNLSYDKDGTLILRDPVFCGHFDQESRKRMIGALV